MIQFDKLKQEETPPASLRRALTFSATGNMQDDLERVCEEIGCTRSAFVVAAIEHALQQYASCKPSNQSSAVAAASSASDD